MAEDFFFKTNAEQLIENNQEIHQANKRFMALEENVAHTIKRANEAIAKLESLK